MAINFPSSPSVNQTYVLGDRTWIWTGTAWQIQNNVSGYTGSQGVIGYTGSAGNDGSIGYTGSAGSSAATAGQVIQVLTATDQTQRSSTSTSFVTGSNALSISITPSSASNKIFILCSGHFYAQSGAYYTLYRNGSTNLGNGNAGLIGGGPVMNGNCLSYLDSPSTTSSTTYQIYMRTTDGSNIVYLNYDNSKSSITCFEIKG